MAGLARSPSVLTEHISSVYEIMVHTYSSVIISYISDGAAAGCGYP